MSDEKPTPWKLADTTEDEDAYVNPDKLPGKLYLPVDPEWQKAVKTASKEATDAGLPAEAAKALEKAFLKLDASGAGRKEAEKHIETALLKWGGKVQPFLLAGLLSDNPLVKDVCARLMTKIPEQWDSEYGFASKQPKPGSMEAFLLKTKEKAQTPNNDFETLFLKQGPKNSSNYDKAVAAMASSLLKEYSKANTGHIWLGQQDEIIIQPPKKEKPVMGPEQPAKGPFLIALKDPERLVRDLAKLMQLSPDAVMKEIQKMPESVKQALIPELKKALLAEIRVGWSPEKWKSESYKSPDFGLLLKEQKANEEYRRNPFKKLRFDVDGFGEFGPPSSYATERYLRQQDQKTEQSLKALEKLIPHWTKEDAEQIVKAMSPDAFSKCLPQIGEMLRKNADKLPEEVKKALPGMLASVISAPAHPSEATIQPNPRMEALKTLQLFLPHLKAEDAGKIALVAGLVGADEKKTAEMNKALEGFPGGKEVQQEAAKLFYKLAVSEQPIPAEFNNLRQSLKDLRAGFDHRIHKTPESMCLYATIFREFSGKEEKNLCHILRASLGPQDYRALQNKCGEMFEKAATDLNSPLAVRQEATRQILGSDMIPKPIWAVLTKTYGDSQPPTQEILALAKKYESVSRTGADTDLFGKLAADLSLPQKYREIAAEKVYSSGAPLPAWALLDKALFGPANLGKAPTPELIQLLEKIQAQFPSESPQELLARVSSNVDFINSLPGGVRAKLMGWDKLSDQEKTAMLWCKAPEEPLKTQMKWDSLTEEQKENLRWASVKVNPQTIIGQLSTGSIKEPGNNDAVLLKPLSENSPEISKAIQEFRQLDAQNLERVRETLQQIVSQNLLPSSRLAEQLQNAKTPEDLLRVAEYLDSRIFGRGGDKLAACRHFLQSKINDQKALGPAMDLAKAAQEYRRKQSENDRDGAHRILSEQLSKYGPSLEFLAPELWKALYGSSRDLPGGQSVAAWGLKEGKTQCKELPRYENGEKGFEQALGLKPLPDSSTLGLAHLKPGILDSEALKNLAIDRIDADPHLIAFNAKLQKFNSEIASLQKMVEDLQERKDHVDDKFIAQVKERINKLREEMRPSPAELKVQERINAMQAVATKNGGPPELLQRLEAYKTIFNIFRGDRQPYAINSKDGDAKGKIEKFFNDVEEGINSGKLRGPSCWSWLKENIVPIGCAVAAVAITVGTFGAGFPAAGLLITAAGIAGMELGNYAMYKLNEGGYSGWGDPYRQGPAVTQWLNKHGKNSLFDDGVLAESAAELGWHYAKELLIGYATFKLASGVANSMLGAASKLAPPPNAEKLGLLAAKAQGLGNMPGGIGTFMKAWTLQVGIEFAYNAAFTAVQVSGVEGIKAAAGKKMEAAGEAGERGLNFGIAIGLAMFQGARGRMKLLENASPKPGNPGEPLTVQFKLAEGVTPAQFAKFMETQGFQVQPGKSGQHWELRPIGAGKDVPPLVLENMEAKSEPAPKLEPTAKVEPAAPPPELPAVEPPLQAARVELPPSILEKLPEPMQKNLQDFNKALSDPTSEFFQGLTEHQKQSLKQLIEKELSNPTHSSEEFAARVKHIDGLLESLSKPELVKAIVEQAKLDKTPEQFIDEMIQAAGNGDFFKAEVLMRAEVEYANDPAVAAARAKLAQIREEIWGPIGKHVDALLTAFSNPNKGMQAVTARKGPIQEFAEHFSVEPEKASAVAKATKEFVAGHKDLAKAVSNNAALARLAERGLLKELDTVDSALRKAASEAAKDNPSIKLPEDFSNSKSKIDHEAFKRDVIEKLPPDSPVRLELERLLARREAILEPVPGLEILHQNNYLQEESALRDAIGKLRKEGPLGENETNYQKIIQDIPELAAKESLQKQLQALNALREGSALRSDKLIDLANKLDALYKAAADNNVSDAELQKLMYAVIKANKEARKTSSDMQNAIDQHLKDLLVDRKKASGLKGTTTVEREKLIEAAKELAVAKEKAIKRALEKMVFGDPEFKPYIEKNSINEQGKWVSPPQPDGSRIEIPIKPGQTTTVPNDMLINTFSHEGQLAKFTIPKGAEVTLANDGHGINIRIKGDPSKGIGDYIIRIAEPKDSAFGLDYRNGYVRVVQEQMLQMPKPGGAPGEMEWVVVKINGNPAESNVAVDKNGKPMSILQLGLPATNPALGITEPIVSKPAGTVAEPEFMAFADGKNLKVYHISEVKAMLAGNKGKLTLAPEIIARKEKLQALVDKGGPYQNKTHFHILPSTAKK